MSGSSVTEALLRRHAKAASAICIKRMAHCTWRRYNGTLETESDTKRRLKPPTRTDRQTGSGSPSPWSTVSTVPAPVLAVAHA